MMSLFGVTLALPAQAVPLSSVRTPEGYDARLTGQWLSKGYGYVLDITPDRLNLYHVADGLCLKDQRDGEDPDGLFVQWQADATGGVAFTPGPEETLYAFDRLAALPESCRSPQAWTPEHRFAFVTATLRTLYPSFERRGVDWPGLMSDIRRHHPRLDSDADLWEALSEIYEALGDSHSELSDGEHKVEGGQAKTLLRIGKTVPIKTWMAAYRDGILNDILAGQGHHVGNQKIFWGRRGDIGYLNILTMGGYGAEGEDDLAVLDAILDDALTQFTGAKAVIVDVSNNRGGYDTVARAIAARFTDEQRLAYTKIPAATPKAVPQTFHVRPSERVRFTGPVHVLISDITVSAGETFVMTMTALPNVTTIGTTTRGALSDQLPKPLDNGWTFTLSSEIYRDSQGRWLEGQGIAPDKVLDIYGGPDPLTSHSQAVLHLMDGLNP